jgi:WD domain, G-beta repeat
MKFVNCIDLVNFTTVPSTEKLLTTLVGHMSSITDLHYSNAGDRIVTASQKDGVARIWSFGSSLSSRQPLRQTLRHRFLEQKQIVLRLNTVNTAGQFFVHNRPSRRKIGSSDCTTTQSAVTCDVAVWNSDDTKIITSQSAPAKGNRQDIIPGSQFLLIWDSCSGNCLIAIKQAHSQQCPVVVSHPLHASIICSAGADGLVKLWDLETGKCLFHHKNTNSPISISHTNEQSKQGGYLDGRFDPNGEYLLLTDDSGQISIFDCLTAPGDENGPTVPLWMTEQYFANDYYELIYDSNGYCIERGSEKPPHLAPRAVRCNHAGVAWDIDISETFRYIRGPSPVSLDVSMSERKLLRYKLQEFCARVNNLKRATIMTNFDPERTIQIYGTSDIFKPSLQESSGSSIRDHNSQQSDLHRGQNASHARSLSNNYRWRDYDDIIREEVANDVVDPDVEDEDFIPRGLVEDDDELSNSTGSDSLHQSYNDHQEENRRLTRRGTPRSQRANRRENHRQRDIIIPPASRSHASRVSSRHRREGSESQDEDGDLFDEILSTNNHPSGPYIDDYNSDGHLFKLPNANNKVNRAWLLRNESISSYRGRKVYVPQAGDSVVYIPKAHAETIRAFPALKAPWKEWPSDMNWPIVRCKIRNLRYRFPFKEYYKRSGEE